MKKIYCLDTNVLISDTGALNSFEDNDVIVPMVVLEELDKQKSRQDEVGKNARHVSRTLDDMRAKGSLINGVKLPGGGTLRVAVMDVSKITSLPPEMDLQKADNMIIAFMLYLTKLSSEQCVPILVSKDINVRIKCDALGIKCEDYLKMRITNDPQKFYRGVEVIDVHDKVIDEFYNTRSLVVKDKNYEGKKLYPNEIVILKSTAAPSPRSAIAKCKLVHNEYVLLPIQKIDNASGLTPRNKEQTFSLDLLFDDSIRMQTLLGVAGSGKTLLAIAAGLEQLKGFGSIPKYDKIIITRPVQPMGNDLGFLPGTILEKMDPWLSPIRDNLNFLMNGQRKGAARSRSTKAAEETWLTVMQRRGLIEVEALTYVRGRSIPNAYIALDECQNLSIHELKTIITRVGENTKIVLTGDIEQIDNCHVDMYTNGLTYAVEKFKEYDIAGHVTLQKGERSQLATLASRIL